MQWKILLIKFVLETLYRIDQGLRKKFGLIDGKFKRRLFWSFIRLSDTFNKAIVNKILDRFGWPYKSVYGELATLATFYVVMHSEKNNIEKYIRLLSNAVKIHEADCQSLCFMIDRLLKYRGKKQIYGNAIRGLKINGNMQYFIYPIVNPKMVNQRREKAGLVQSIEDYALSNNAILDYNEDISIRLTQYSGN